MKITSIKSDLDEFERLFLSLGDKTRLRLLSMMAEGPVSVGFLAEELGESQPKVSRHLAYLRNAGVVSTRRDGKWIYYGIQSSDDEAVNLVMSLVVKTLSGSELAHPQISLPIPKPDAMNDTVGAADPLSNLADETIPANDEEVSAREQVFEDEYDDAEYQEEISEQPNAASELEVFLL